MRIDVAVRVLPVDEPGKVVLLVDDLEIRMNPIVAKRLAPELINAARRAEKLATTKTQVPRKEPLK